MYDRILLTLDGSELARGAIAHAIELAKGTGSEVVVLEVVDSIETDRLRMLGEGYEFGAEASADELAERLHGSMTQAAHKEVEAAAEALRAGGVSTVRTTVAEGLAGNVILDVATKEGAGAVVMATRGHSGLGREVTGSVAEYVLRHADDLAVMLVGPRVG